MLAQFWRVSLIKWFPQHRICILNSFQNAIIIPVRESPNLGLREKKKPWQCMIIVPHNLNDALK